MSVFDSTEFHGKKYYPASFFWKNCSGKEIEKVQAVCRILNKLTPEQIEAVEYLVRDRELQQEWNLFISE